MHRAPGILAILLILGFLILVDYYVFTGVRALTAGLESRTRKIIHWVYWGINISLFLWLFSFMLFSSFSHGFPHAFGKFFGVWIMFFIPKLVFSIFLIGEDAFRLMRTLYAAGHNVVSDADKMALGTSRRKFISTVAAATAAVPFIGIIHGLTAGKFKFTLHRETVFFPDLPDAFDGFTITQLSDIHSGSFDVDGDRADIQRGIQMAIDEKSDLFVFTGDLVNNIATEIDPWMSDFAKLRAPYGQFSILGNHDYGDYVSWDSPAEKEANMQSLYAKHAAMGYRLMRNEHTVIEKNGQQLYLVGVENWGSGGFTKKGDLDKALAGVPKDAFKILLSHDPSHFDEIVSQHPTQVHLTLAGHTHGAQFGVEIPGIKWSPIKYRYPHWAGLYEETKRYIYVNRGFGFLAFPGRVGIWPEITVITLRKGNGQSTLG